MGERRAGHAAAVVENFHNVVIHALGEARQVVVKLFLKLARFEVELIVNAAEAVAAARVYLFLQSVGKQHLVPFRVERESLNVGGKVALRKRLAEFIDECAVADGVHNIGKDVALIHRRGKYDGGAVRDHLHVDELGSGAQRRGRPLAAAVRRAACISEDAVAAAGGDNHCLRGNVPDVSGQQVYAHASSDGSVLDYDVGEKLVLRPFYSELLHALEERVQDG